MRMIVICTAALAAASLLCSGGTQAQASKDVAAPEGLFKTLDRNVNGCIDIEEGRNYATRRFHALDKNADGSLDASEAPLGTGETDEQRPITAEAWQDAYPARFNALDSDGNQCLDQKEVDAARAANVSGGQ